VDEGEADDLARIAARDPKAAAALGRGELVERGLLLTHLEGDLEAREQRAGLALDSRESLNVFEGSRLDGEENVCH
jgi:hypothetical protein